VTVQNILGSTVLLLLVSLTACSEQTGRSVDGEISNDLSKQAKMAEGGDSSAGKITLNVFKSPSCSCCGRWVEHAEQGGFSLTTHHPLDLNKLKAEQGIAPQYQSCHTAVSAEGYVFEGHVPARYVRAFLAAPPENALGLSVPAMPVGSPGMEMGERFMPYQVLLLKRDGSAERYADVTEPGRQYD